ncbi:beta-1,3-galactosyltransferase 5-like [Pecten maximus]|uniref:beta-1,3-galactosyltransferase 5-like n=1 Tax=Pecten maximus TaxID=6579 RepID=UPI001457ED1F|nr:beta-1,3-galactosyltransferase 5-like [Pecten maximus]
MVMAQTRKSSRSCENVFAGFVIFACGMSIIISMQSQTFIRTKRAFKLAGTREIQENRNTFLAAIDQDEKDDGDRHEHSQTLNDNGNTIKDWFRKRSTEKHMPTKFHPILVRPELISSSACKNTTVDILIYSVSFWRNADQRAAIRGTWAARDTFTDIKIQTVFFLGRPTTAADQAKIESESQKYGDVIQGDFLDGRANISMKGLHALQWINSNCLHAKYIIKADDDMFVNIFYVIEFGVSEIFTLNKVLLCHVRENNTSEIMRNKDSKWYVPANILPGRKSFPAMCFANMVLFTADLVPELYRASFSMPYCTVDDAYIFGMLVELVKGADFQSIGETISMDQDKAYQDLISQSHPQFLASTIRQIEFFSKFWNAALRRVPKWAKGRLSKTIKP